MAGAAAPPGVQRAICQHAGVTCLTAHGNAMDEVNGGVRIECVAAVLRRDSYRYKLVQGGQVLRCGRTPCGVWYAS